MADSSNAELTAQDIKRIRGMYGLSQKAFARVLGIGDASIVRYENGQVPTRAISNLIRAAENPEFFLECLERAKDDVPQVDELRQVVYTLVDLDEKGNPMNMTDLYMFTLDQEVLGEKASQIIGKLTSLRRAARSRGDQVAELIFDDLIKQLWLAKSDIPMCEDRCDLASLEGKISSVDVLVRNVAHKVA